MKKGQGISINMLILIVLGVIVLIIAVMLVVSKSKQGNTQIDGASQCGLFDDQGTCTPGRLNGTVRKCDQGYVSAVGFCKEKDKICCKPENA